MSEQASRPRRSALYLPASNARAIEKSRQIPADVLIFDFEDAVAPAMRESARAQLIAAFETGGFGASECVIRINAPSTSDFQADIATVRQCRPAALLIPKVSRPDDLEQVAAALDGVSAVDGSLPRLWAMIETPTGLLRLPEIVQAGQSLLNRLECLVVGTNDLAKETGVSTAGERRYLLPWLMQIVLHARDCGLTVLDGVWNDFRDTDGFDLEAMQGREMGFDGKTLIHPTQVDPANRCFAPAPAAVAQARRIVAAFEQPEHRDAGVINLDGAMVERLHLAQAQHLLAVQAAIDAHG